jgi:hypothetical protein
LREHDDIRHRLSEYLDRSVTAEEAAAIEAHLKTCQPCRDALHELQTTMEHIKNIEEIEPPAWMTQKIMTTVRAEAERKKSTFRRLFYPLTIKLPIQAIAVLFLVVAGFYIYQDIQTRERSPEAPVREFAAAKQAPQADTERDTLAKADRPAPRSKQAQQTPAYKSLDMKQEYETPSPPVPVGKAAEPAAARPAGQPLLTDNEAVSDKHLAAPFLSQEQIAPVAKSREQNEGKREFAPAKKNFKSTVAEGAAGSESTASETTITVSVKDINEAAKNIEAMIKEFDGTIIATQRIYEKRIYIVSLDTSHANDLLDKLKHLGVMKEKNPVSEPRGTHTVFKIELNSRTPKASTGC